jgi:cyclic pyranopterin phosphate synthase
MTKRKTAPRGLTHVDARGHARMVDVGEKPVTRRIARASARVRTRPDVIEMIREGRVPKGDVAATARLAGILAAKTTHALIPLCHPLPIDSVAVDVALERDAVVISATVACTGRTGVEMEALTAAAIAALTVYDMCKAADRSMVIERVRLEEKSGGRTGHFRREEE